DRILKPVDALATILTQGHTYILAFCVSMRDKIVSLTVAVPLLHDIVITESQITDHIRKNHKSASQLLAIAPFASVCIGKNYMPASEQVTIARYLMISRSRVVFS